MCSIAPGGIPPIPIGPPGDIAASELPTINAASIAETASAPLNPMTPEFRILARWGEPATREHPRREHSAGQPRHPRKPHAPHACVHRHASVVA